MSVSDTSLNVDEQVVRNIFAKVNVSKATGPGANLRGGGGGGRGFTPPPPWAAKWKCDVYRKNAIMCPDPQY